MPRRRAESAYSGWVAVKLRYLSLVGAKQAPDLVEDRILLFQTDSSDRALSMALEKGHDYEDSYENALGEPVHLRFEGVVELLELFDEPGDAAEVWWDFWEPASGERDDRVVPSTLLLRPRNAAR